MAQNFIACDRGQVLLLPPCLDEWLPAGHLARFVIETVDQLDLSGIFGYYRADGRGRPAHDPAMMTALVLYNYAVGVRSSRAIERRCVEDVACRVITANRVPDHATIARFRGRHEKELSGLFVQVLGLCHDAGMVRVGVVAVDSTKLHANASVRANRTRAELVEEARRIFEEAAEIDAREDELYGEARGDELPEELADPSRRAQRIRELLEAAKAREEEFKARRVEQHAAHAERVAAGRLSRPPGPELPVKQRRSLAQKQYNLTDPDSGIVRQGPALIQGYSVQSAVGEGQVILAMKATSVSPDSGQLAPTIEQAEQALAQIGAEEPIKQVLADTGYWDARQIQALKARGMKVLIPPAERKKRGPGTHPEVHEMRKTLKDPENRQAYRKRQTLIEPIYGQIKHNRGITRLLRRGKQAVQSEIDLIATTHNLLKLHRHTLNPA